MSVMPSQELRALAEGLGSGRVAVGVVVDRLEGHGLALLLLMLGIPALVPSPGVPIGIPTGVLLCLVALPMMAGRRDVWLPGWLARRDLAVETVRGWVSRALPWIERAERRLRPLRMHRLTGRGWVRGLGALVFLHGVLIALPIPLGNFLPGVAVILFGLGLLARDGGAVLAGLGLSLAAVLFSAVTVGGALWLLNWLAS